MSRLINFNKLLGLSLLLLFVSASMARPQTVNAVSGADWKAGNIIDDSLFYDNNAMSTQDIQNFLNSKVPVCDTYGSKIYSGSQTRAQFGASRGYPAPYTCLKDYTQNGSSAAAIIKTAANTYSVSPRVLLVMLQKEQSLISDDWPWSNQYRSAMGYGCPDTAPCDAEYYGFYNQVMNAAKQIRRYATYPSQYTYKPFSNNYIQYNPSASCGGSSVYIENLATAGLYIYTPYQPNASALANLYGSGDSCGAYGNRNFWRMYNDWFGPTKSGEFMWKVIRTASDGRLFLQVANTKRWIPTSDIYTGWTLDRYPVEVVSQSEFDAIPTIPELGRVGKAGNYHYLVEGGRKHYIKDSYMSLWGYGSNYVSAPVDSLLRTIPENEPIGRFIANSDNPNNLWLMNSGSKSLISFSDALQWGYSSANNLTGISTGYLNSIPNTSPASTFINYGGSNYIVDRGQRLPINNQLLSDAWGVQPFNTLPATAPSLLPQGTPPTAIARSENVNAWYYLENGKKHYITSAGTDMWGINGGMVTTVSQDLLSKFTAAPDLSNLVRDNTSQAVYLVDGGKKYYIPTGIILSTWLPQGQTASNVQNFSSISLSKLTNSINAPIIIKPSNEPNIYVVLSGKKYNLTSMDLVKAWGYPSKWPVLDITPSLSSLLPSAGPVGSRINDGTNNYVLDNGTRRKIPLALSGNWGSSSAISVSSDFAAMFYLGTDVNLFASINGNAYLMENGFKRPLNNLSDNYGATSGNTTNLSNDTSSNGGQTSYLVKSSDTSNTSVWLISKGKKYLFNDFSMYVSYGYLSRGLPMTSLTPESLAQIPTATETPGLFIRREDSYGIKFINFGSSLGFPDGDTLNNLMGSAPVLIVSNNIYDSFALNGSVSRILKDDVGKIYLVESGKKRWITNSRAYDPYRSYPVTYLYGTTIGNIPNGPNID